MMVNGNIGAGVAVAGAFSLVRFRSAAGTGREISAVFIAMGAGLIAGMGYLTYAVLFALLLGWYPILRPKLQHLRQRPLRIILKLVIFNLAICLVYALLLFVFTSPDLQAEATGYTLPLLMGTLVLGNVTFFVYDLLLARVSNLYVYRLRPKLFSSHF